MTNVKQREPTVENPLRAVLDVARKRRRIEQQRAELQAETDRVVLELVELHAITQREVGRLLGVTEQRASQMVKEARARRDGVPA